MRRYTVLMQVKSLWRYPVKSMQGERLKNIMLTPQGVLGDRNYGVLDRATGTVLSAKQEGRLLQAAARLRGEQLFVTLPGETEQGPGPDLDKKLSHWLSRDVSLIPAPPDKVATFQAPEDFQDDDSRLTQWNGPIGSFADSSALHIITTGELELLRRERADLTWDIHRFRPNIEIASHPQDLLDSRLTLGPTQVVVEKPCSRCVMVTRPQNELPRELDILRHLIATRSAKLGVRASVTLAGTVRIGDAVAPLRP